MLYLIRFRYTGEHWVNNQCLATDLAGMAAEKGVTSAQLALSWILAQSENIIPIPGTKRMKYLEENARAVDVDLSVQDMADIEKLLQKYPNVGNRYNEHEFKFVNK